MILIDAIVLKVREGQVFNRPVYVAMGVSLDGYRDVLGMWVGPSGGEGAKQWITILSELKNRGVQDVCISVRGARSGSGCPAARAGTVRHRWGRGVSFGR